MQPAVQLVIFTRFSRVKMYVVATEKLEDGGQREVLVLYVVFGCTDLLIGKDSSCVIYKECFGGIQEPCAAKRSKNVTKSGLCFVERNFLRNFAPLSRVDGIFKPI